jgi:hypothetical protein
MKQFFRDIFVTATMDSGLRIGRLYLPVVAITGLIINDHNGHDVKSFLNVSYHV